MELEFNSTDDEVYVKNNKVRSSAQRKEYRIV